MTTLRRDGYGIAKGVFSAAEVRDLRERFTALERRAGLSGCDLDPAYLDLRMPKGDALAHPELETYDYIVLEPRVVGLARELLGPKLIYHGDSSVQLGTGPRGFHKDNADRTDAAGVDWQGEYGLIRFGLYLQDHRRHSGGLKVRLGSHKTVSRHRGHSLNLAIQSGDVVFWYLTTTHSGNVVRLRWLPKISLHPRLEGLLPRRARAAEPSQRMALFCTLAAPGVHLERYIEFQRQRQDVQIHWRHCGSGPHLNRLAAARGVLLNHPSPDYGATSLSQVAASLTASVPPRTPLA